MGLTAPDTAQAGLSTPIGNPDSQLVIHDVMNDAIDKSIPQGNYIMTSNAK